MNERESNRNIDVTESRSDSATGFETRSIHFLTHSVSNISISLWLDSHRRWIFWGLLALSLASRLIYAIQFAGSPLREWHRWPDSDMAFFDEWSQDIAAGNWLQRQPHHPLHSWHVELAELYFEQGGRGRPAEIPTEIAARTLWNRWYGGARFHQEPLYPYLLAFLRKVTSQPLIVLFGMQLLAGIASNLLLWEISRRCFGPLTGLVAGLLAVLSPTLLYPDLVLLRESFITCYSLSLVWLTLNTIASPSLRNWAILGVAGGFGLLLKATLAIFVAGCAGACLLRVKQRAVAMQLVVFLAGVLAGISPVVVRNVAVGAPTFSLSSVAAITLINTNAADSDPLGFSISWEYAPRIMGQTGGSLVPAAIQTWQTHTPRSLSTLLWQKWSGLWNGFEAPDNISFGFFQLQTPVLRWLPFTFAVLSPLSLVGLVLSFAPPLCREPEQAALANEFKSMGLVTKAAPLWPLWLLVGNHLIALLLFTQVGRLRVPLVAALIPFAAFALVQLHQCLWSSRTRGALLLIALGLTTAWTLASTPAGFSEYRVVDFEMGYRLHYNPRIEAAAQNSDWALVASLLQHSLDAEPLPIRKLHAGAAPKNERERELAEFFANAHASYANALEHCGRAEQATSERQRSEELRRSATLTPSDS